MREDVDRDGVQWDMSGGATLGVLGDDREKTSANIDVGPPQASQLPETHTAPRGAFGGALGVQFGDPAVDGGSPP